MDKTIKDFLKYNVNWDIKDINFIERIGGLSSENYKIIYNSKEYFLKICKDSYLHTDRINELNILNKASHSNISPKIIYYSKDTGNMISEWIDGFMPSEELCSSKDFLNSLSYSLKKLHNLECEKIFNPFYDIKLRIKKAISLNLKLPTYIDILLNKLDVLENKYANSNTLGLCHNDLNVSNIIISNKHLYFVDYEYSAMGDIFFDLATISWFFSDNSRQEFLHSYFGKFRDENYSKLLDYLFIVKFYNATWSLLKSYNSNSTYDYLLGANLIFEELSNPDSIRKY